MKQDTRLIRVDLDFKNALYSAGHSSLWKILEGFGVPDVSLLSSIYEDSTMRIQVGSKSSAAIQLDTGTVQGSALSPLLFDIFINALLRLLDSTGISHCKRGVPDWNIKLLPTIFHSMSAQLKTPTPCLTLSANSRSGAA